MAVEIRIPTVGESISEVVVAQWLKADGAWVAKDEAVVELETDKINQEVVAPEAGILRTRADVGATLAIGALVAMIEPGDKPAAGASAPAAAAAPATPAASPAAAAAAPTEDGHRLVTSVARKMAAEHSIPLEQLKGTGAQGRITKSDVESALETRTTPAPAAPAPAPKPAAKPAAPAPVGERAESRERMTTLRKRIAQRLVEAQHTAAMLTTFNECDMTAAMELRKKYQDAFTKRHGVKLGFMSFFVKAAVEALRAYPRVNAFIEGDEIVYHHYNDIGVAVGTDRGLVVPVIRNAEKLNFAGIEKTIAEYGARARDGKLGIEDLSGGTFTISNGGVYGSMMSTPILNPPQSGILGMHNIIQRPIAIDGQVVVRPMMYLALSYDHRIVDGKEAVGFLVKIKDCIEAPERLLFDL